MIEGRREPVAPRLHTVIVHPAERKLHLVYGAHVALPRVFVPGIHKRIPLAVSVDGDAPVEYPTPPTFKEQRAARPR